MRFFKSFFTKKPETVIIIPGVPADIAEGKIIELTPRENVLRFLATHDIEYVRCQDSLCYTAIVRTKV